MRKKYFPPCLAEEALEQENPFLSASNEGYDVDPLNPEFTMP